MMNLNFFLFAKANRLPQARSQRPSTSVRGRRFQVGHVGGSTNTIHIILVHGYILFSIKYIVFQYHIVVVCRNILNKFMLIYLT